MKADFTRLTFKREKHYNGVRMQQGRVQVDADWNEQLDIQAHLRDTQSTDVIGACGAPRLGGGFEITAASGGSDLLISPGRMYVDGMLCENEPGEEDENEGKTLYTGQPYNPGAPLPDEEGLYAVYLDVWERHITAIEDAAMREVALGGPDTATRTQTLWQVKLMQVDETNTAGAPLTCWDTPSQWTDLLQQSKGLLSARAEASEGVTGPCIISAEAGYRRLENQLYRVEIHNPGAAGVATFKWSRDNAILVSRVQEIKADRYLLVVSSTGKDDSLRFGPGQWVEITDEKKVLRGEPGVIVKLKTVEENSLIVDSVTWDATYLDALNAAATLVTVRRWDQSGDGASNGAVPVPADTTEVALEDGVKVRFHGGDANYIYNSGDYWLIPARTVGGDVEWPKDGSNNPIPEPPHGIYHHYCKLALVDWDGTNFTVRRDCRPLFPALTEPDLYYISGDGQEAMPGDQLPQPLRVGVTNCNRPIEGAWVKFEIDKEGESGDGYLTPTKEDAIIAAFGPEGSPEDQYKWFIIATDENGEAECIWKLRDFTDGEIRSELPELPAQQVRATLLREPIDSGDPASRLDRPLVFSASFGVAWEDRYGGSVFPDGQHGDMIVHTVEDALDQLRQNVSLSHVGGDGQEAMRGARVKMPLQVRAANGDWPFEGATVRFTVLEGHGSIAVKPADESAEPEWTTGTLDVLTGTDGLAECVWKLDENTPSQFVTAALANTLPEATDNFKVFSSEIRFTANLSVAEEVTYDGARFPDEDLAADTVETALDQLRENIGLYSVSGDGQEARRGEQVPAPLEVRAANGDWPFAGATIEFEVTTGQGGIWQAEGVELVGEPIWGDAEQITKFSVLTDSDGLAQCFWRLDDTNPAQQVTARLIQAIDPESGDVVVFPSEVRFNANLSIADEVTYDGARFPETQHPYLQASTVATALDQLRENIALYYVSGDGQEIKRYPADEITYYPGKVVVGPGQVVVAPGQVVPGPGPVVAGPGPVAPAPGPLITGSGPATPSPSLIVPTPPTDMRLSEIVRENVLTNYVLVTKELPKRLQVRAANGDWPFRGAAVTFRISEGTGDIQPATNAVEGSVERDEYGRVIAFTVVTDAAGLAECRWRLDLETQSQQVTASLASRLGDNAGSGQVFTSDIRFNATLSIAEEVSYRPPEGKEADTVQAAIDDLYSTKVDRAGDTITGSLTIEGDLTVKGERTEVNVREMVVEDNILRVNRFEDSTNPPSQYAGLEVYRGKDSAGHDNPTAQLLWDNQNNKWKIGRSDQALADVACGPNWVTLTDGSNADALHKHAGLYSPAGKLALSVDDSGNVGISSTDGTERKLTVRGTVEAKVFRGDGSQLSGIAAGLWKIGTGGDINYTGGKVGIGTVTPAYKLTIGDALTLDQTNYLEINSSTWAGILFHGGGRGGHILYNHSGNYMYFGTSPGNGTGPWERMRISSIGNVGIGTADPKTKLQIDHDGASTYGMALRLSQSAIGNSDGPKIEFFKTMKASKAWSVGILNGVDIGDFSISEDGGFETGFGSPRFTIKPGGNVGVGTTDPKATLHVEGNIISTGTIYYNKILADVRLSGDVYAPNYSSGEIWGMSSIVYVPQATAVNVKVIFSSLLLNPSSWPWGAYSAKVDIGVSLDGQPPVPLAEYEVSTTTTWPNLSLNTDLVLTAGSHTISIQWQVTGSMGPSATLSGERRMLVSI